MRSKRNPSAYYGDILTAIERLREYCAGLSLDDFRKNAEKQDAVLYRLQTLSEAAHRLRPDELALCPSPNWRSIRDLGNIIRNEYDAIDTQMIWDVIQNDLPPLRTAVEQTMRDHFPTAPRP